MGTTTNEDETWYIYTMIIAVNIIVSNVVLVKKKPQAVHLAISETRRCRATNLGEYSHHNNDAQYVAIKVCTQIKLAIFSFLVTNLIVLLQWGQGWRRGRRAGLG